jgi:hypothetical protein
MGHTPILANVVIIFHLQYDLEGRETRSNKVNAGDLVFQ